MKLVNKYNFVEPVTTIGYTLYDDQMQLGCNVFGLSNIDIDVVDVKNGSIMWCDDGDVFTLSEIPYVNIMFGFIKQYMKHVKSAEMIVKYDDSLIAFEGTKPPYTVYKIGEFTDTSKLTYQIALKFAQCLCNYLNK
jgi:hypothetical protein